jgi:hypothetical protein
MGLKVFVVALLLCVFGLTLSAEKESPPLVSRSTVVGYMFLVQPPLTCRCLEVKPVSPKQGPVFSLDIPLSPFWDTVREDRIQNRTIQFGGSATPWKDTVVFGGWPVVRINFATADFRVLLEGGNMKTLTANSSRTMEQVHLVPEGSIWYVLVGIDGFFGQEQIPGNIKGLNFNADFSRRSYGGQGWLGLKLGDFNRSFVAGRYGKGYVRTEGYTHFNIPGVDGVDWMPLYLEEFKTKSLSFEGKAKTKIISQSVRFDKVEYQRVVLSPDPLRFGENRLQDMWLRTETEVIPFSRLRFLRGVVVLTKDFKDQNRLMFFNDYSSVRVLLRLSF